LEFLTTWKLSYSSWVSEFVVVWTPWPSKEKVTDLEDRSEALQGRVTDLEDEVSELRQLVY
jgi:hypothetical protein